MPYSFDGLDINDGVTYFINNRPQLIAPSGNVFAQNYGHYYGGKVVDIIDGIREIQFEGDIIASTAANLEAARDTLLTTYRRRNKRLVASHQDSRFWIASLKNFDGTTDGPHVCHYRATFVVADPYLIDDTPFTDVRTPALALVDGNTTGYVTDFSLTLGGNVEIPLRIILTNQAGGVTPLQLEIINRSVSPENRFITNQSMPARSCMIIDRTRGDGLTFCTLTNVIGWWPLQDASGTVRDMSGNSIDLTANGTPTYLVDGLYDACMTFNGTNAFLSSSSASLILTGNFSMGCWLKTTTMSTNMGIMGRSRVASGYTLRRTSANVFEASFRTASGTIYQVTGDKPSISGQWVHVQMTRNSTTNRVTVYINGVKDKSTVTSTADTTTGDNDFTIGRVHLITDGATTQLFTGQIYEPYVMDICLTDEQAWRIYADSVPTYSKEAMPQFNGKLPSLTPNIPGLSTNALRFVAHHGTTAPTFRLMISGRSRYA